MRSTRFTRRFAAIAATASVSLVALPVAASATPGDWCKLICHVEEYNVTNSLVDRDPAVTATPCCRRDRSFRVILTRVDESTIGAIPQRSEWGGWSVMATRKLKIALTSPDSDTIRINIDAHRFDVETSKAYLLRELALEESKRPGGFKERFAELKNLAFRNTDPANVNRTVAEARLLIFIAQTDPALRAKLARLAAEEAAPSNV